MKPPYSIFCIGIIILLLGGSCTSKSHKKEAAESDVAEYIPKQGRFGSIHHINQFKSEYIQARDVDIWLPPNYDSTQSYPVIYMHDGQNLFNPETSYAGTSWEIDVTLTELIENKDIPPCIVVGIWNTENRTIEYTPAQPFSLLSEDVRNTFRKQDRMTDTPRSDAYLTFIVTELKPYIDSTYPSLRGPEHTSICGSSMGGLISLYALAEYPETFGNAACVSTHWPLGLLEDGDHFTTAYIEYLQGKTSSFHNSRLYFDYGTETLDAWYEAHQIQIDSIFREMPLNNHQYQSTKYEGGRHNELAWQKRFDNIAIFLLAKNS